MRLHGDPMLEELPPPLQLDPVEDVSYIAARTIRHACALTPKALSPEELQLQTKGLNRLARRVVDVEPSSALTSQEAILALHTKLKQFAQELPQFEWHGTPPSGDVPKLLPGCLAFYQYENYLVTVLEQVDWETLADVDWDEVGLAAQDAQSLFGMATPWQLRAAASHAWVDSLYFRGFERAWGADILGDLEADEAILLRRMAGVCSEQLVEKVPLMYLSIEDDAISKLIHDTQNVLLNAGLRAELFARFAGREFDLPEWTPPGREVPQHKRVAAAWGRWRELTAYYARLWGKADS
jgi:hypothetical protein